MNPTFPCQTLSAVYCIRYCLSRQPQNAAWKREISPDQQEVISARFEGEDAVSARFDFAGCAKAFDLLSGADLRHDEFGGHTVRYAQFQVPPLQVPIDPDHAFRGDGMTRDVRKPSGVRRDADLAPAWLRDPDTEKRVGSPLFLLSG